MPYHTASTMPACVRPEVVKGWNRMWDRIRRRPQTDRALEFSSGTPLIVGATRFTLRRKGTDWWRDEGWVLSLGGSEVPVHISCAFGCHKPYTYMDKFQAALDELIIKSVSEA